MMRWISSGIALAGAASALFIVGDGGSAAVVRAAGPPGVQKDVVVTIFEKDGICDHKVDQDEDPIRIHRNVDPLQWKIVNQCNLAASQRVLLCVYRKDLTPYDPFRPCHPHDIGTIFSVEKGHDKLTTCIGKDTGEYLKQVLIGSDIPGTTCPTEPVSNHAHKQKQLAHIVDIAIEP
jgi:hypothetical protein